MDIWNNHYQESVETLNSPRLNQAQMNNMSLNDKMKRFELIMAKTQKLIDSGSLHTEILEECMKDNESYFFKSHKKNTQSDVFTTEEEIDRDVDENYIGGSSALLQAEKILKNINEGEKVKDYKEPESTPRKEIQDYSPYLNMEKLPSSRKKSSKVNSQSLIERFGSPSRGSV